MTKRIGLLLAAFILFESAAAAGAGSANAKYAGGTLLIKHDTPGASSIADENDFVFAYKSGALAIPYRRINALEYGPEAGRRVGLASLSPVAWFSRKHTNFLTVNYRDEDGRQQAAVFELAPDIVRSTVSHMAARTGQQVEYDNEEARRSVQRTSRQDQAGLAPAGARPAH